MERADGTKQNKNRFFASGTNVLFGKFPVAKPRGFLSLKKILAFSLLLSSISGGMAYADNPVLRGSLVIKFSDNEGEISQVFHEDRLTITIPNQGHFAGLRIPRTLDGQPFRGQKFTVSVIPSGCQLDGTTTTGEAFLHVSRKEKRNPLMGTVFNAAVSSGQYHCLFGGAAQAMPYDPFDGNHETSVLGEFLIWWEQILSHRNLTTNQSVKEEVYQFFGIQNSHVVHRLRFRAVEYDGPQSPGCQTTSVHIHCNRGGSADGMVSAEVRVKFGEQDLR